MSCKCDFGKALVTCHCAGCHRTFTSVTPFDLHQKPTGEWGKVECTDPATMFKRNGDPVFTAYRETPEGSPIWGTYDKRSKTAAFSPGAGI
jgi:hypothetical protein